MSGYVLVCSRESCYAVNTVLNLSNHLNSLGLVNTNGPVSKCCSSRINMKSPKREIWVLFKQTYESISNLINFYCDVIVGAMWVAFQKQLLSWIIGD